MWGDSARSVGLFGWLTEIDNLSELTAQITEKL